MLSKFLEGLRQVALGPRVQPGQDLRSRIRVFCRYPVVLTAPGADPRRAYVVDIGLNGMRLEDVRPMARGTRVEIASAFPGGSQDRLEAEVVWCRERIQGGHHAGVRYEKPAGWARVVLEELGLDERRGLQRRKHVRIPTTLRAELRHAESNRHLLDARVENLSMGGLLLRSEEELDTTDEVICLLGPSAHYPSLCVDARPVGSVFEPEEGHWFHSLELTDLSAREVREIGRLVVKFLKERGG